MIGEVGYNRRKPPEWDGLVDYTEQLLQAPDTPNGETVQAVHDRADSGLDNERLDVVRYYGEGLVVCAFARRIRDLTVRERLIGEAGDQLSRQRTEMLSWEELALAPTPNSVMNLVAEATEDVPPAPRLLANVLKYIACYRQTSADSFMGKPPLATYTSAILDGGLSTQSVGTSVFAGAYRVLQRVAEKHAAILAEGDEPAKEAYFGLIEPATVCSQDIAALGATGLRAARLRVDELRRLAEYLDVNNEGEVVFIPACVPKDLSPPNKKVLHHQRLGCPAINVPGLIPQIMEMAVGIVNDTNAKTAHNRWQADHPPSARPVSYATLWRCLRRRG